MEGEARLGSTSHYLIGADPAGWRSGVPHFGQVRAQSVYPGIDVVYYGREGELEFDFIVRPGANPGRIRWTVGGRARLLVDVEGRLVARSGAGQAVWRRPEAYQMNGGRRRTVRCGYVLDRNGAVALELGEYDRRRELVIDPVLMFSSYVGGSSTDGATAVAVDASGYVYVAGNTLSPDLAASGGVQPLQPGGASDIFVMKVDISTSTIVYCTYLGGLGSDTVAGIAVDSSGQVYLTGTTTSTDLPMVNAVQAIPGGGNEAFVAKLNASGSALVFSTFLGGAGDDNGQGIAVSTAGLVYVAGSTTSADFPVLHAYQSTKSTGADAFLAVYGATGASRSWATYLGGAGEDTANGVAVDASGNAYVVGTTSSTAFPVTAGAVQTTLKGTQDAFVTKFASGGASLAYSTYLGGNGTETGLSIAVNSSGQAVVTGNTTSADFPTANAYQGTHGGGTTDAFVTKLNSSGGAWLASTYLGGTGADTGRAIAYDVSGNIHVAGETASADFPQARALQGAGGSTDAFYSKFSATAAVLIVSSHLGGSGADSAYALAPESTGGAVLAGVTASSDLTLVSAVRSVFSGGSEAFLAQVPAALPTAAFRDPGTSYRILTRYPAPQVISAGGALGSVPVVAQTASSDTFIIGLDTGGSLWGIYFSAKSLSFGSWIYGGGVVAGTPAMAMAANGTAYIAARDAWKSYWLTTYTPGTGFGGWAFLAGIFTTDPVMTACPDGSIYIIGRDSWNSLWSGRYIPGSGFQGWYFGGGIIQGYPAATCGRDNVVYVTIRDNWNSTWMARVQGNTWLSWNYGGGIMTGDPQIMSAGDGNIYLVIRDSGSVVWYRGFTQGTPDGWLPWVMSGGILADFSVAADLGEFYITGRTSSNELWWYRGGTNTWTYVGQPTAAASILSAAPH